MPLSLKILLAVIAAIVAVLVLLGVPDPGDDAKYLAVGLLVVAVAVVVP